ncbi:MAG: hypothetical protein IPI93_06255 [Sphingobacteriaceae bacterium]|nr:hypothetical protein [Sphingobacteriaceae bacterium]MBK7816500.1 hypothetical protein [Sphingobacteriaceae bacterium]
MKKIIFYILLASSLFSLTTCKKYPENRLWFKNPERIYPFQGNLTKYTVNGIDSLDLLNAYWGNQFGLVKDIRQIKFSTTYNTPNEPRATLIFSGGLSTSLYYSFGCKKRCINISMYRDTAIYKKRLFISDQIAWKINRLAKSGPFKIETTLDNGNKYEIQIE